LMLPSFVFLVQVCICYSKQSFELESFEAPLEFLELFNAHNFLDFNKDCMEFVDHFGEWGHIKSIKSYNTWAYDIYLSNFLQNSTIFSVWVFHLFYYFYFIFLSVFWNKLFLI
jgi:hypothetical protein